MSRPPADFPSLPPDDDIPEIPQLNSTDEPGAALPHRPKRSSGGLGLIIAVVLGGVTAVGAFFGIKASGWLDPRPAPAPEQTKQTQEPDSKNLVAVAEDNDSTETDSVVDGGSISVPAREKKASSEEKNNSTSPPGNEQKGNSNESKPPVVQSKPANDSPKVEQRQTPRRLPQPSDAEVAKEDATLDEVYADRIRSARTFEEKSALAQSILDAARSESPGSALQFAMFKRATRLAIEAAHPQLVDDALAALDKFDVDLLTLRAEAVESWAVIAFKELKGDAETAMQRVLAQRAANIAGEAWSQKRFDVAEAMFSRAELFRDAAGDSGVARSFAKTKTLARSLEFRMEKAQALDRELQADPGNPQRNLEAGLAFAEARMWDRACECFEKGSDNLLKSLAANDRRLTQESDGDLAAGDLWWGEKRR